jgi:hypothetical protein
MEFSCLVEITYNNAPKLRITPLRQRQVDTMLGIHTTLCLNKTRSIIILISIIP